MSSIANALFMASIAKAMFMACITKALFEPVISTLDPRVKKWEFHINLWDHNLSAPVENFINQMIYKIFFPIITYPTRVNPNCRTLI